ELKEQLQARTDFNVRRISELYDLIQQLDPHISKARRGCFIYEDHTQVPLQSFHT
ncbi:Rok-like winged helix domain-containing protein, partial [Bacillus altitudinis]|uniref:Rok-like winged helix domain-containing protein n=2 Tax=Bacillaceae TaxID=186817 RepID=UPI003F689899